MFCVFVFLCVFCVCVFLCFFVFLFYFCKDAGYRTYWSYRTEVRLIRFRHRYRIYRTITPGNTNFGREWPRDSG